MTETNRQTWIVLTGAAAVVFIAIALSNSLNNDSDFSSGKPRDDTSAMTAPALPGDWFEVSHEGGSFICGSGGLEGARCVSSARGTPTANQLFVSPDLYCSKSQGGSSWTCDERWFPSRLDRVELKQYEGDTYVCDPLSASAGRSMSCFPYTDGDPYRAFDGVPSLYCNMVKCSESRSTVGGQGVDVYSIDGRKYVCRKRLVGPLECFQWSGLGSPDAAIDFIPDLYCSVNLNRVIDECSTRR
jgi:hypothetical protein